MYSLLFRECENRVLLIESIFGFAIPRACAKQSIIVQTVIWKSLTVDNTEFVIWNKVDKVLLLLFLNFDIALMTTPSLIAQSTEDFRVPDNPIIDCSIHWRFSCARQPHHWLLNPLKTFVCQAVYPIIDCAIQCRLSVLPGCIRHSAKCSAVLHIVPSVSVFTLRDVSPIVRASKDVIHGLWNWADLISYCPKIYWFINNSSPYKKCLSSLLAVNSSLYDLHNSLQPSFCSHN